MPIDPSETPGIVKPTPEFIDDDKEVFPERPTPDSLKLALSLKILEQGVVFKEKNELGQLIERVNPEKLAEVVASFDKQFETVYNYREAMAELTPLPKAEFMEGAISYCLKETEQVLKDSDLLPENFEEKQRNAPPLVIEYLPDYHLGGHFINHDVTHMFGYSKDQPQSILRVGGESLLSAASYCRKKAREAGQVLSQEQSIRLVVSHIVAHEYGHYLESLYDDRVMSNQAFFKRAEQVSPSPLLLDDKDNIEKEGVHNERFAQSIAAVVVKKTLRDQGLPEEVGNKMAMWVGAPDARRLKDYKQLLEWGHKNNLSSDEVSGLLLRARMSLRDQERDEEAERIEYSWRWAGYYTTPYDEKKLRYIIKGQVEKQPKK